jgi:peptidase E
MQMYLFSSGSQLAVLAQRMAAVLAGVPDPVIGWIPAASLDYSAYQERAHAAFDPLGALRIIDLDTTAGASAVAADIAACHALWIPGGNTYLLAKRMHRHKAMRTVREAVRRGLPLFTASAGTVFCGPNMLTTNDWNVFGTTRFDALGLCPTNFNVHFTLPPPEESESRDFRIRQYIAVNRRPVLALEEACYLDWTDTTVTVQGATCWRYTVDGDRQPLAPGATFAPQELA